MSSPSISLWAHSPGGGLKRDATANAVADQIVEPSVSCLNLLH